MSLNSFQRSLDRYLTSEPEDNFTPFCEAVGEAFSPEFYERVYNVPVNTKGRFENSKTENRWLNKLFSGGVEPQQAAKIIERAYNAIFIGGRFIKTTKRKK